MWILGFELGGLHCIYQICKIRILGECLAFLASGSDPTDSAGEFVFHWRSWFLFDLCTHDISTDFSMNDKNKTDMEVSTLHV